jgi:Winged helix DNA-binding domain
VTERVLSTLELNRALLARQLLLERVDLPIPTVVERVGGLQGQYAPAMYVALWTRLTRFERADLDAALDDRSVVQATLMRSTIHLVAATDYWPFALAIREVRRAWWLRLQRGACDADDLAAVAEVLRARLADGPVRYQELKALVGDGLAQGVGFWLDQVRVPPSGTWARRRADLYGDAEMWIGPPPPPGNQLAHLVRSYLGGFGPAAPDAIASWSGVPIRSIGGVLASLDLARFRTEDGTELFDVPDGPLPPADTPAPVRFLPVWETCLLAHARRAAVLPEEHRIKVFQTRKPQSVNTFLVGGSVAGVWRHDGDRVVTEPFAPLSRAAAKDVRDEAERLHGLYR